MDFARRSWEGKWSGNALALLDAAEAAAAAAGRPVMIDGIQIDWETGSSQPSTIQAARNKLLASPPPMRMQVLLINSPAIAEQKLGVRIYAAVGHEVLIKAKGTEIAETVAAYDAAVAVLKEKAATAPATAHDESSEADELEPNIDAPPTRRSWLRRNQAHLAAWIAAIAGVIAIVVTIIVA
jgi:hypothetical protein